MTLKTDTKPPWLLLAALMVMNLLNYVDRYVVTALLPELQADLHLSDGQAGFLGTAFMMVYFLSSPLFGWLGDLGARPRILGFGVAFWSLATAAAGLARGFPSLFCARAAVGIGEAAYGSIAPSLITDWFPKKLHGRALSFFYMATPVGSALGYLLGGLMGARLGWRPAFFVVGLPGIALSLVAFAMKDPTRDHSVFARLRTLLKEGRGQAMRRMGDGAKETYGALLRNRLWVSTVAGYTAYTFALGGFAFWAPSYMMRVRGFSQESGMMYFGGITVVTGVLGTLLGGWLGDLLRRYTSKGYTWLSVIAMVLGSLGATVAILSQSDTTFLLALVFAELCLFLNTGPINALIVGSVPKHMRASAMASSIFCIHLFGDAISPVLIGWISDRTNLSTGMLVTPGVFLFAGILWSTTLLSRRTDAP